MADIIKNKYALKSYKLLDQLAIEVAPRLLGSLIVREIDGQKLVGRIVETEAYDQNDTASHSYKGRTPRTDVIFGPPGYAYVYFTYGMHYCFNIVTGLEGQGSAVLIRALEPIDGIEHMRKNRKIQELKQLANGPAKLCQAFIIDKVFNGHNLSNPPLYLQLSDQTTSEPITQTTRVGISKNTDKPWRFYITGNAFVSKR